MAGSIPQGKIVTDIDINQVKAVASLRDLKQAVQSATSAWKAQSAELRSAGKATEAASAKYKGLGEAIEKQKAYINRLKEANVSYQNSMRSSNRSTKEGRRDYNNASEALQKNVRQLNSARTRLASLTNQQNKARTSMNYYKNGLASAQKELRTISSSSSAYVTRLKAEGHTYAANTAKLAGLRSQQSKLTQIYKLQSSELSTLASRTGKTSNAYLKQKTRVDQTATSIAKVNKEINQMHPTGFNRVVAASNKVVGASNKIKAGFSNTWQHVKAGATTAAVGIGALGAAAVKGAKQAGDLQQSYKEINNLLVSGGEKQAEVTKNITTMQKQGRNMSIQYGKSQQSIASAYEDLVKRGYSSKQALGAMRSELQASVASGDDFNDVVSVSSQTLEAFGMRANSTAKMTRNTKTVVNELAYAADMTSTGFKEIGVGMQYTGATAHQTGVSLSQTASALGILSNNGLEASKAGTGLNQVLNRLSNAAAGLKKGDKNNVLASLGIKPKEIMNSKGNLKSLSTVMSVLDKHMKGMSKTQKVNLMKKLFGVNGEAAGLILAKNNQELAKLSKNTAQTGRDAKYVQQIAAKNSETAKMQMARLKQAGNALAVTMGKKMLPAINEAGDQLVIFLTKNKDGKQLVNNLSKAVSTLANGFVNFVKWAAKHKTAVKWIGAGLLAGWSVVKAAKFISWLGTTRESIAALKGSSKVFNALSGGLEKVAKAPFKGIKGLGKGIWSATKWVAGQFKSAGKFLGEQLVKGYRASIRGAKGLFGKGNGAGKLNGLLQSAHSAGGFKNLSMAGKIGTGLAGAGVAVDAGASFFKAFKDRHNADKRSEDIGQGLGAGIGGGIGLWFGGPLGAALGAKIGGIVGKWGGQAVNKFTKGWQSKKPPKSFWSLANLGWSAHSMWNGFTSSVGKTIKWFSKVGKNIQKSWKGMTRWFSKLGRNMAKGLKSAWKGMTKWFSNIGKGIKKSWRSMTSWFRKLGRNMSKGLKSAWHSITSWFSNIAKGVQHGWSGMTHFFSSLGSKTVRVFKSAWHGITSWFKGIVDGIKNAWDGFWSAVSGPIKFMGKLLGGKVKIGSLHLASGTDWRRRYPIPAIVNDGNDSPETNNREGLIDRDGTLKAFPNIRNFKYWLLPGQEVVNARDMAMFGAVRHFAKGTKSLGISRLDGVRGRHGSIASITAELKVLAKQLKLVQRLARRSLDFKFLKKNQKQLNKFTSTFKQLVKADKKLNTETKHSVTNFKNLTRRLNSTIKATEKLYKEAKRSKFGDYIDKQARKAVKSLRGKGNFAKQFKKLTNQFTNSLHKFRSSFKHDWAKLWEDAHKEFEKWTEEQLKNQKKFKNSFEKGFKAIGSGIEKVFRQTWSNMKKLAGKGMNAVIKVLNSGISRVNSVVHQFGGSSSIHHVAGVRYANGTSKVNKPTLAIVNDGSDSPETGNKEAFYRPSTGEFGIFQGRNTQTMLMPGDEVLKASETRDLMHGLGYEHFANGSGGTLHALYELTKKFYKNPSGTLNAMFGTAAKGFRKVMHSIVANAQTVGQNQAQEWWSTLWTMVHKKIDGGGAATGLLKAVENLGRGKKYVWGAWGPSAYDCSGLVSRALQKYYHKSWGRMNVAGLWHHAHRISQSQAKPGDPIFWLPNRHVGIYIDGDRYWSAYAPGAHPDVGVHSIKDSVPGVRPTFGRFYGVSGESHGNSHVKANTPLQRLIRGQVGKGFWRTISKIAEKYGASLGAFGLAGSLRRRARTLYSAMHRLDPRATRNGIAAILGNWVFESGGLNPGAVNGGSGASGLGQWLGGRLSGLKAYARRHHTSWRNPALQLRYAYSGDGANTSIFRRILRGHGSVASLAAQFSNRWERGGHTAQHVAGAEKIVRALGFANGGITNKPAIFGEAGPEMAIPLMPAKSTRAWELIGKAIAILSNQSGIAVNQAQQQQEQKEDHKFRKEIIALLTAIATGQGQTIQTKVDVDGRTFWQQISKYAKEDQRHQIIYGRKGFSSGFTI